MTDVALAAQAAQATGVVVANYDRWTYSISSNSHSADDVTIPFFNLGLEDGRALVGYINNAGAVAVTLPPISDASKRTLTEIQLRSPYSSESGFYEAAQA